MTIAANHFFYYELNILHRDFFKVKGGSKIMCLYQFPN